MRGDCMYESIAVIGERGQITIPKSIREIKHFKPKDKVIIKIENKKIVIEKTLGEEKKEELMKEYYRKYAKLHKDINKEWETVDKEANRFLR